MDQQRMGSPVSLDAVIDQYAHRLNLLELFLGRMARSGLVGSRAYKTRMGVIQTLIRKLDHLRLSRSIMSGPESSGDVGLPSLAGATPDELRVTDEFLSSRLQLLETTMAHAKQIHEWITDASRGTMSRVVAWWRLSRLRARLVGQEVELRRIQAEERSLHFLSTTILSEVGLKSDEARASDATGAVEALFDVYGGLDHLTTRIARLRDSIVREESHIQRIQQWLYEQEGELRVPVAAMAPPSPLETASAVKSLAQLATVPTERDHRRLALATRFAKAMEQQVERAQEEGGKKKDEQRRGDASP